MSQVLTKCLIFSGHLFSKNDAVTSPLCGRVGAVKAHIENFPCCYFCACSKFFQPWLFTVKNAGRDFTYLIVILVGLGVTGILSFYSSF